MVLLDGSQRVISINNASARLFETEKDCVGSDFITIDRTSEINDAINAALADGTAEVRITRSGREYQLDITRIERTTAFSEPFCRV